MVGTERGGCELRADWRAAVEFHGVALAVSEADGFDMRVARQCPGETGGGVLSAREQYDGSLRIGVGLTYARWIDNGDGTVTDTMTGLRWLKQADCLQGSWTDALAAVAQLASAACGLADGSKAGDWRMPNRNEMQSLQDRMVNNEADFMNATYIWKSGAPYQAPIFGGTFIGYQYYWTSTSDAADAAEAWTVFSCDFGVYDVAKSAVGYTLAVR